MPMPVQERKPDPAASARSSAHRPAPDAAPAAAPDNENGAGATTERRSIRLIVDENWW